VALPPLTHHEILELVEPFTRRGRRVDLAASDRLARQIVWQPVDRPGLVDGGPPLRETLTLDNPYAGGFRLTRELKPAAGPSARLQADGPDPGELLARIEAVAPARQFRDGDDGVIALRHEVEPGDRLVLTEGLARVGGLDLSLRMPTARRYPAEITLTAGGADFIELPEDLLSVIGWDWAPLKRVDDGWQSKLRLRRKGAERSRRAEVKLERTVAHLARTLAEPPRRFHERFLAARWFAVVRRTIPVWTCVALIAAAVALPIRIIEENPALRVLLMNAPLFLIALSFTLQEQARLEIPPLPRASPAPSWRRAAPPVKP